MIAEKNAEDRNDPGSARSGNQPRETKLLNTTRKLLPYRVISPMIVEMLRAMRKVPGIKPDEITRKGNFSDEGKGGRPGEDHPAGAVFSKTQRGGNAAISSRLPGRAMIKGGGLTPSQSHCHT